MRFTGWLAAPMLVVTAMLLLLQPGPVEGPGGADVVREGEPRREVHLVPVEGVISPLSERYLRRELRYAEAAGAGVVVVRLDTPGGLETAMRRMVESILGSPVPVVVWVGPSGARAASAGMFLTIAAHVASMAPGTNIGAAHPVGIGGADPEEVMASKVVNDAAALARALAETRGRNAEWAEQAVRESVSATSREAIELGIIDLISADLETLLLDLDGRRVEVAGETVTLRTAGAPVVERRMGPGERFLQAIIDPNIAYILFTIGVIGIISELYSPGTLFPGITGVIALLLAFTAFGSLPVNWAGILLLVLAAILFGTELMTEGVGLLGVGALVAFVLGSLMLFTPMAPASPALPAIRVSPWLVGVMVLLIAGFFAVVGRSLLQARRTEVATGARAILGRRGVALTDLSPYGRIEVDREDWTAIAEHGDVRKGDHVRVVGVEGVTLHVEKEPREDVPPPPRVEMTRGEEETWTT